MKKQPVGFKIDPQLLAAIDRQAEIEKRTRSAMIHLLLEKAIYPDAAIQAGKTQIDPSFFQGGRA